jgi:amino acid transporter
MDETQTPPSPVSPDPAAGVNIARSQLVANAQTVIVSVVLGILVFAVVTVANMHPHLLAFSGYPPAKDIIASVALTFFAFVGFGIITFTAKDLRKPGMRPPVDQVTRARKD